MRSRRFLCAALAFLVLAGTLSACGRGKGNSMKRKIRDLPADFAYAVRTEDHTVSYTDSQGRTIDLYGRLWEPDAEGVYPAVILCHGFNGRCTDFHAECRRFAARGYVCYAFDFCGAQAGGKSAGRDARTYTPRTMVEEVAGLFAELLPDPEPEPPQAQRDRERHRDRSRASRRFMEYSFHCKPARPDGRSQGWTEDGPQDRPADRQKYGADYFLKRAPCVRDSRTS